jgi:hypothetical protein
MAGINTAIEGESSGCRWMRSGIGDGGREAANLRHYPKLLASENIPLASMFFQRDQQIKSIFYPLLLLRVASISSGRHREDLLLIKRFGD